MSQQYKHGDRIPTEVIAQRLDELSDAATKGEAGLHEFYMRIPAELDHDADLVLHAAAKRLRELEAELTQTPTREYIYIVDGMDNPFGESKTRTINGTCAHKRLWAGELNCHELITDDMVP